MLYKSQQVLVLFSSSAIVNMAAMFIASQRLLLATVLLLAIAQQASMETASDFKLQNGMDVRSSFVQDAPKIGAPAPTVRPPPPLVGAPPPPIDCKVSCGVRCKLHSRPNVCLRACGTCCARCKCVPPGQSGSREVCGSCYTEWKTHNNQTKCP